MSNIKDQIVTLLKQRHHSHKVALEQEKDPRSKHAIDLIARIREDSQLIELIDSLPEEKQPEDLEEEIDRWVIGMQNEQGSKWRYSDILRTARHFAEWGARHSINWADIQLLDTFILELSREEKDGADWGDSEKFYTEVLRRFHEFNDKKIPEIVTEWEAKHLK